MHALIIFDHPYGADSGRNVPHERSLAAAALDRVLAGLHRGGHTTDVLDLHREGFDPVLNAEDLRAWRTRAAPRADVLALQARLDAADHLVLIFPVWWMAMPALTKGFLDRVLTKGYAFEEEKPGSLPTRLLTRLRGVSVIQVLHTPTPLYRAWFGQPATRILGRGTFRLIGIRRFSSIVIDRSAQRGAQSRERVLRRIEQRYARLRDSAHLRKPLSQNENENEN
ncbi:NAD(P)H-dependent oxidoreductase [Mycetocola tolaasinivorans]|uniref:NAD(P)H-dependent oxidoreductase n=1 Tax=Mycetocola tolaasinivorans TaxID=76635 RepID=UPI00160477D6|nr:NAD(P)H-dependent oxidoreductase [Mycetocola tolaasinivorans]